MNTLPPTASRRERKKQQTRKHLLDTALRLMTETGFDTVTVEAIAEAADVGKGTVYNYFQTKEEIVVGFFIDLERRVQKRLTKWTSDQSTLAEVLTSFVAYQFRLKRPHYQFVRIFFAQMFARTEQMYPYIVGLQSIIDPPLVSLFESLQARGLLRRDISMESLVLNFKTMHFGLSAVWALEGPPWRGAGRALPLQISLFCSGLETRR